MTGMFKNPEFQQHSTVDKRGRKVEKRKNQENMRKYYKLKDEVCPLCAQVPSVTWEMHDIHAS